MRSQSFPTASVEDWKMKSEESLKGKSVETLGKNTFENIKLKPLYTRADDQSISQYPAQGDFRRGYHTLGYISKHWEVAQKLSFQEGTLKEALSTAFTKGQTAISFEVNEDILSQVGDLEEFQTKHPYSLNAKEFQDEMISRIEGVASSYQAKGYIAKDPIALLAERGAREDITTTEYKHLYETVEKAAKTMPQLKTVMVDTTPYHNGGANAIQELAIAIATGVHHIEELKHRGLALETILSKLVFQFSIGSNFFMELSKLRAARVLWKKVTEAYGVAEDLQGMIISAYTSSFTKTVYDPYVNMLRSGNEAFAAVLGGIQYLHVSPFNEPEGKSTAFSERIARNTQLILSEEANLTKTIDPAGGSWYVEFLTTELAQKAWELFLLIEDKGGIVEGLKNGWIQSEIDGVREQRIEAISTRKQTIVGTNKYADLQGEALEVSTGSKTETGFIHPIPQNRLSEPYELLRKKAAKLKTPSIGLITIGNLKSHKARMDFITGFLAPGGISGIISGEVNILEEAKAFIENTNYRHYCLCGSDDAYETSGLELIRELKVLYPEYKFYLAGLPKEKETWLSAGITDFLHVRSNCYMTLSTLLEEMEAKIDE